LSIIIAVTFFCWWQDSVFGLKMAASATLEYDSCLVEIYANFVVNFASAKFDSTDFGS